jgi:nicotinamidase-related amidase
MKKEILTILVATVLVSSSYAKNIPSGTDKGLLTRDNCAVVFVDYQPQMTFGVNGVERQQLVNNVLLLAKGAKLFGVPSVLTTVETKSFSGYMWPQLLDVYPDQEPIERSSMNSWDSEAFRTAIKATGKKNIIIAGLWTEVCVAWPTLNMIDEGYNVFVVEDASAGTSPVAHRAAMDRMIQAGAIPVTTIQTVLEFQRDWADKTHYDELLKLFSEHGGAYGQGIEYAYTMVHGAPQSRKTGEKAGKTEHQQH